MDAEQVLATRFAAHHPPEVARRLETLSPAEAGVFLGSADAETAAAVLDQMLPAVAAACMQGMEERMRGEVLELLSLPGCVRVLRGMSREGRTESLQLLPQTLAAQVQRLLGFAAGTAGAEADPAVAAAATDMTVSEARSVAADPNVPYLYIVDREQKLAGVIHKRDLQKAQPTARLADIMTARVIRIPASAPLSAILGHQAWRDLDVLPVVDNRGVYLGAIRYKNLRRLQAPGLPGPSSRSMLATALDLGELYWAGLSSMVTALATSGANAPQEAKRHDS